MQLTINELGLKWVTLLINSIILNVGFGNGYESVEIFSKSKNLIAVDISEKALL